jgi:4-aminobutyrate--pyruvate transaminase
MTRAILPNSLSNSLAQRDIEALLHPYSNPQRHREIGPVIYTHGEGIRVFDDKGKPYIEGLSAMWCLCLGYGEERLIEAAERQMRRLPYGHLFSSKSHEPAIELAEKILEHLPIPMSKVFFTCSGSEANDTHVRLIWYYFNAIGQPRKRKILSRWRSYHGVTVMTASISGVELNHHGFGLPIDPVIHVGDSSYFHCGILGESEEDFSSRRAQELEDTILAEGPETVAAFFAEPIVGGSGVVPPPRGYFEKIQAVLRKYNILFVCDEVICGFGRTGEWFGSEVVGAVPDAFTLAKNLSSGYQPIGASVISEKIYEACMDQAGRIGSFNTGFTYGGHPVCCAVALETLKIYDERKIIDHARNVGNYFQKRLRAFADDDLVGDVRGVGLIGAIELVRDKSAKTFFDRADGAGAFFARRAEERGLLLRCIGGSDIIALAPPLILNECDVDEIIDILDSALSDTKDMLTAKG